MLKFRLFPTRAKIKALPRVFSIQKVHHPKIRFLAAIEVILILIVILGKAVGFLNFKKISPAKFFGNLPLTLVPKQATESVQKRVSFEEQVKSLLKDSSAVVAKSETTAEGSLLITAGEGTKIYFNASRDTAEQVTTLQTVLSKAKIDGKQVKKVDFRFDKLVVEY